MKLSDGQFSTIHKIRRIFRLSICRNVKSNVCLSKFKIAKMFFELCTMTPDSGDQNVHILILLPSLVILRMMSITMDGEQKLENFKQKLSIRFSLAARLSLLFSEELFFPFFVLS